MPDAESGIFFEIVMNKNKIETFAKFPKIP